MCKDIGEKIKKIRHHKHLSQIELAQKAGIAQSTLSYIESGKKAPQFDTLSAICKGLGVSLFALLSQDAKKSEKKMFEQRDGAALTNENCITLTFSQDLPADALQELLEFQKYIDYKYGQYIKQGFE